MNRIALLIVSIFLLVSFSACNGTEPAETTAPVETQPPVEDLNIVVDGVTDFVIVRPDVDRLNEMDAAVFLRNYLKACGLKLKIQTDWEGDGISEHEIVVGHSARLKDVELDLDAIGDKGYLIAAVDGRIYIVGSNSAMTQFAVEEFLTEYFGYKGDPESAAPVTALSIPGDLHNSVWGTYAIDFSTLPQKEPQDASVTRKLSLNILNRKQDEGTAEGEKYVAWDPSASTFSSLKSTDVSRTGNPSLRWLYGQNPSFTISVKKDLSAYKAFTLYVYADEAAVGQTFLVYFQSENFKTEGIDYYSRKFTIETEGWNYFGGKLSSYSVSREPLGWDQITQLCVTSTGWSQNPDPRTVLYVDGLTLYTNEEAAADSFTYYNLDNAAAFSVNGSRAIIDQLLIKNSYLDDDSVVFTEKGTTYLPLAPFAAANDDNAEYNATTHVLTMTYGGKKYVFTGNSGKVQVDGKTESLGFAVRIQGDSLFVPLDYAMKLFGYSEQFFDEELGLIVLSNVKKTFPIERLLSTLEISYATLFERPTGDQIVREMYSHLGADVHPRVMMRQEDFDRLKGYVNKDETFTKLMKALVEKYGPGSSEYAKAPVEYALTDGVRLLARSREAMNRIIPMSFLYKITGDKAYAERVWSEVKALCNFPDWHPAHYLDTAEILYPMAIAYDWLYDYWTPERRETMEQATLEFGLKTGLDRYEGRAGIWGSNNWSGVCNGGLVSAAFAYSSVYLDECTRILGYAVADLEKSMFSYAPDGGYLESPGYWAYGTNYTMIMISSLESATGRDYGLYNSPGFAASAYFIPAFETELGSWGFHDSGSGQNETMTLFWFAKKSADPALNRLRLNSINSGLKPVHVFDLMWYDPDHIADSVTLDLDSYYRQVGAVTMRSTWDKGAIFVGLHGGNNAASHGDLDIGNFVLDALGKRFFVELGSDDYNIPGYFGNQRWQYYRKRAEGQNTLVLGNPSYKTPDQNASAVSRFSRVESGEKDALAVVDMAPAYKGIANVTEGYRGILFTDDRSTVIVQDELSLTGSVVRWAAHTRLSADLSADGRVALLRNGDITLYCEIVSDNPDLHFTFGSAKSYDPNYPVTPGSYTNNGNKLMIVTDTPVTSFRCAVVMKPYRDGETLPEPGTLYTWTNIADWKIG